MKITKEEIIKILKDTAVIFAITLVAGLGLGFVYELTKDPIAKQEAQAQADACNEVFKEVGADGKLETKVELTFNEIDVDEKASAKLVEEGYTGAYVDSLYEAKLADGTLYGYVIGVTSKEGYGGNIKFYMGITTDDILKGISILSISETPGLGMNAPTVLVPQFRNKKLEEFVVVKTGALSSNEIDAITSATITSNAVTGGVNTGVRFYQILNEGGSDNE
jgi:electron transport complex protein RnfG